MGWPELALGYLVGRAVGESSEPRQIPDLTTPGLEDDPRFRAIVLRYVRDGKCYPLDIMADRGGEG